MWGCLQTDSLGQNGDQFSDETLPRRSALTSGHSWHLCPPESAPVGATSPSGHSKQDIRHLGLPVCASSSSAPGTCAAPPWPSG
jgi:hypothetical protein